MCFRYQTDIHGRTAKCHIWPLLPPILQWPGVPGSYLSKTQKYGAPKRLSPNTILQRRTHLPLKRKEKNLPTFFPFSFQSSFSGERQNVSCCSVIRLPTDRALLLATIRHGWIGEGKEGGGRATLFISTWPETHTTSERRKESGAQVSHIFHSSFFCKKKEIVPWKTGSVGMFSRNKSFCVSHGRKALFFPSSFRAQGQFRLPPLSLTRKFHHDPTLLSRKR